MTTFTPVSSHAGGLLIGVAGCLAGFCPGPGIVSLGASSVSAVVFVATMTLGIWLQERTSSARQAVLV